MFSKRNSRSRSLLQPSRWIVLTCSGQSTTNASRPTHVRWLHAVASAAHSALPTPSALREVCSLTPCGGSPANSVTALAVADRPRSTWSGGQGFSSSFSAMQNENLPGLPRVDMSIVSGRAPPRFSRINWNARPSVLLARATLLKTFCRHQNSSSVRTGPLTTISGAAKCVVACTPCRLKRSSHAARTSGISTRIICGGHPAITALAAIFSTVAAP